MGKRFGNASFIKVMTSKTKVVEKKVILLPRRVKVLQVRINLTAGLSSMGLLGFDLSNNAHFYRRLPFKTERILSLNPRLKNAKKLVDNLGVEIIEKNNNYIEAKVSGTNVFHKVVIDNNSQRCTCNWFTNYQGKRGICKHILAVKMVADN